MTLPVAFYMLVWVFATSPQDERQMFFANKFETRIECLSKATEIREQVENQKVQLTYSRLLCVPVPGDKE